MAKHDRPVYVRLDEGAEKELIRQAAARKTDKSVFARELIERGLAAIDEIPSDYSEVLSEIAVKVELLVKLASTSVAASASLKELSATDADEAKLELRKHLAKCVQLGKSITDRIASNDL